MHSSIRAAQPARGISGRQCRVAAKGKGGKAGRFADKKDRDLSAIFGDEAVTDEPVSASMYLRFGEVRGLHSQLASQWASYTARILSIAAPTSVHQGLHQGTRATRRCAPRILTSIRFHAAAPSARSCAPRISSFWLSFMYQQPPSADLIVAPLPATQLMWSRCNSCGVDALQMRAAMHQQQPPALP